MVLPVSVCVIARDEATKLGDCLDSVSPYVSQVVVVDTGSLDATPHIARRRGALVRSFTWCDDFSAARNYAASLATQPHIFVLDADERLVAETLPALAAYCRRDQPTAATVRCLNVDDDGTLLATHSLTRLYPNLADYQFMGRVHEQLVYRGAEPPRCHSDVQLLHTGYGVGSMARKLERNLRLLQLAETTAQSPDPYLEYQLGRTFQAAGQHAQAVEHLRAALETLGGKPADSPPYLPALLLQLSYALLHERDLESLFSIVSLGMELYPDYTDVYFLYGLALLELNDPRRLDDIRDAFEHCLTLGEPDSARYESVAGVGTFRAAHNLAVYFESLGQPTSAERYRRLATTPTAARYGTIGSSDHTPRGS